ncbi:MAG: hypothetical protein FJW20_06005 [Acidimicrobiia bacterium]|nr:hypothetical protein [Acidimicrobiia bacterium]
MHSHGADDLLRNVPDAAGAGAGAGSEGVRGSVAAAGVVGGDCLRDEIYELRASYRGVHYRMLYFFHGRRAVVVSHGIVKERAVPSREMDLAIRRKSN